MTASAERGPRFYELDGLRGLWAFLVLLVHVQIPGLFPLFLFMDGFFSLSAFVITLSTIYAAPGALSHRLARFFRSRAARILPGYFIAVLVGAGIASVVNLVADQLLWPRRYALDNFWHYLAFIQYLPLYWAPDQTYVTLSLLDHTWSLAIEEQFYLLCCLFLIRASTAVQRYILAAVCIGVGVYFRQTSLTPVLGAYHLDAFGYGIGFAQVYAWCRHDVDAMRKVGRISGLLCGASFLLYVVASDLPEMLLRWVSENGRAPGFAWTSLSILSSLGSATLVLWIAVNAGKPVIAWLRHPSARYLGRISYALYLSHFLLTHAGILTGVFRSGSTSILDALAMVGLAMGAAHFFTQLLEHLQIRINRADFSRLLGAPKA